MNATLSKALVACVPVAVLLVYSVAGFTKRRTAPAWFQLLGAACLLVVVLTHVAEGLRLFSVMRFGAPDSVGHYLDLSSVNRSGFIGGLYLREDGANVQTKQVCPGVA